MQVVATMKNELLALLTDRPEDIDWDVCGDSTHPALLWVKEYKQTYGELPSLELFAEECLDEGEQPKAQAPWSYYVREHQNLLFVEEATKYLDTFNRNYALDPKKAILQLRDEFQRIQAPTEQTFIPAEIVSQTPERWEYFTLKKGARIQTGIPEFDAVSGGISPDDEFMVLSARLGQGKSMILHLIALNLAKQGHTVGLYSGEMTEYEVGARVDAWLTHISNWELTRGKLTDSTAQVQAYKEEVPGRILVLTPKQIGHNATPRDLLRFCKEQGITAMLIDQLSLMVPDGRQSAEMHEQFASLSMQLKSLQQELRIPFIAVSQLNRAAQEQEINAANISGSDRIGQDATIILALERPKVDQLTIRVLKARGFAPPNQPWNYTWNIDRGILSNGDTSISGIKEQAAATVRGQEVESASKALAEQAEQSAPIVDLG